MRRKGEENDENERGKRGRKEGDIFICLMEWALLLAEHLSNRQARKIAPPELFL